MVAGAIAFSPACDAWTEEVRTQLAARTRRIAARLRDEIPGLRVADPEAGYLLWLDATDVPGLWGSGNDCAGAAARAIMGGEIRSETVTEPHDSTGTEAGRNGSAADASLADILFARAGVLCSPGETYAPGCEKFVRLNAGTSDAVLDEAVDRIIRAVQKIQAAHRAPGAP